MKKALQRNRISDMFLKQEGAPKILILANWFLAIYGRFLLKSEIPR